MLYNRALSGEEIQEDLRTSNITNSVIPMPIPQPGLRRIKVEVDRTRLGKPLENVTVTVDVLQAGMVGSSLLSAKVNKFNHLDRAVVDIPATALARGNYVVRTTAKDAAGNFIKVQPYWQE